MGTKTPQLTYFNQGKMKRQEILERIDRAIDCLTESSGGNAVTESDVKDAKTELNELKEFILNL
jgi:hypothetical protein